MLGKKSKPVIGILAGSLVSGNKSAVAGPTRSHFESKSQSPKGLKTFDLGGVGLGIVAALDKSGEIPANKPLFSRNLSRSNPIPVNSPKNYWRNREASDEMDMGSLEEYTIVTSHRPNKSYTKVYGNDFRIKKCNRGSVFHISPAKLGEIGGGVPPSDFLSSCNMCQKKLHDKDIFMYRGEKAFCSTECRYRQIVMDERTEKCNPEATIRSPAEVASSPYTNGQIFTTGILAI
ncbi:hypothetical protein RD792_010905 [Penstemon davidsonii]|uniref:FLZ-type domain-containing protein n=1 Tax=Penstemon davidsonii TaxID=160366 RepID=A0ABR0D4I6_9LAMI|nr:hypothetical protein RD792_010905 [Penstemon davidsonii]